MQRDAMGAGGTRDDGPRGGARRPRTARAPATRGGAPTGLAAGLALLLLLSVVPRLAAASGSGDWSDVGPQQKLFISPGLTIGGAFALPDHKPAGFVLGGEVSLVYMTRWMVFTGAVVDGLYGWDRRSGRLMIGGEVGYAFGGLDGGYLVDFDRGGPHHGAAVRLFVTIGMLAVYARYGYLHGAPDFMEVGVLLKLPISLGRWKRGVWERYVLPLGSK